MENIKYQIGGKELLQQVQPLWEKLKNHHVEKSEYFSKKMACKTFEQRTEKFMDDSLKVHVVLAKNSGMTPIGYIVSTINNESIGEIDSIFVAQDYRQHAVGEKLMNEALSWLKENHISTQKIMVAEGNENVLKFYRKFGFELRSYVLENIE